MKLTVVISPKCNDSKNRKSETPIALFFMESILVEALIMQAIAF